MKPRQRTCRGPPQFINFVDSQTNLLVRKVPYTELKLALNE
jgi:hypothetical protein